MAACVLALSRESWNRPTFARPEVARRTRSSRFSELVRLNRYQVRKNNGPSASPTTPTAVQLQHDEIPPPLFGWKPLWDANAVADAVAAV